MSYRVIASGGETGRCERARFDQRPAGLRRTGDDRPGDAAAHHRAELPAATSSKSPSTASEGEITDINNRAVALVDGIRENLRVLLVSGEPHAGERTWRNLLKSDASVDLVHFTILRPPEKQDGTPINELSLIAFPTRELFVEKINEFDLIIFDRYQHRDVLPILYYDYIAEYVEKGGALLIAAGPEYAGQPVDRAHAAVAARCRPRRPARWWKRPSIRASPTSASAIRSRAAWRARPAEPPHWSRWFRLIGIDQPEGEVVMKGPDDRPLLVLDRKGEGRVGMFLSDQGWLWARGFEGGGPHVSLYRRIAHWLMKEPELEEERLTANGRGMTLDVRRQTMSDDPGNAQVITPSGKAMTVPLTQSEPGIFSGSVVTKEIGLYQVANGDLTALAHIGPINAPEFGDMVSTEAILKPYAEKTGGSVRRLAAASGIIVPSIVPVRGNAEAAGRDWIGLKTTNDSVLKSVSRVPLFAGFFGLGLLLARPRRHVVPRGTVGVSRRSFVRLRFSCAHGEAACLHVLTASAANRAPETCEEPRMPPASRAGARAKRSAAALSGGPGLDTSPMRQVEASGVEAKLPSRRPSGRISSDPMPSLHKTVPASHILKTECSAPRAPPP